MSDDPKSKPGPPVPSFDELKGPKRPAAPPSHDLGHEEKTSQIDADTLRKALRQSQQGAPIEPAAKPPSLAIPAAGKLPLAPLPQRQAPPPPGARPLPPPAPGAKPSDWDDKTAQVRPQDLTAATEQNLRPVRVPAPPPPGPPQRPLPSTARPTVEQPEVTDPAVHLPQIKPQTVVSVPIPGRAPPPPLGARPTEKMDPVTPDMIAAARGTASRGQAAVQTSAPAAAHRPDLQATQLSMQHRGVTLPEPSPDSPAGSSPTLLEIRPDDDGQFQRQAVTQPRAENPYYSPRADEPSSSPRPAAPSLDAEPPTKNERRASREAPLFDIEADIVSEVKKLQTSPATPALDPITSPGVGDVQPTTAAMRPTTADVRTGVDAVEVVAHPASTFRMLGAFIVDALVLGGLTGLIGFAVMKLGKAPALPAGLSVLDMLAMRVNDSPKLVAAVGVFGIGLAAAYTTLFAVVLSGRTPGRLVFGLRLVDRTGSVPSTVRALLRAIFALVSFALGGLGFWAGLFSAKSRTLHDKLSGTFVVRLGPSRT